MTATELRVEAENWLRSSATAHEAEIGQARAALAGAYALLAIETHLRDIAAILEAIKVGNR